jgi:hypothetical protein
MLPGLPRPLLVLIPLVIGFVDVSRSHPVSQVSATANVTSSQVQLSLEVKAEDLVWFHHPTATNLTVISNALLREAARKHQTFLAEGFRILDGNGLQLPSRPRNVDTSSLSGETLPAADLKTAQVRYSFDFPLRHRPDNLTFQQNIGAPNSPVPCSLDLTVQRDGKWIEKPVNLETGVPRSFRFDWTRDPPDSLSAIRLQTENTRRQRLGITSFDDAYSFIHLSSGELRHELVLPLHLLAQWIDIPRVDSDFITESEQSALSSSATGFLVTHCPVSINGKVTGPSSIRIQFHGLDSIDLHQVAAPRRLHTLQARIAAVLSYPIKPSEPRLRIEWKNYSASMPFLRSTVFKVGSPPRHTYFTKQRPYLEMTCDAASETASPMSALRRELFDRLHRSDGNAPLPQLNPHPNEEIETARLISVRQENEKGFELRWATESAVKHWGHRHLIKREYSGTALVSEDNQLDLRGVKELRLTSETSVPNVADVNYIRTR